MQKIYTHGSKLYHTCAASIDAADASKTLTFEEFSPNKKISTDFVIDDKGETNSIKKILCYINKYLCQFGLTLKTSYINESKKKEYSIFHLEHDPFITKC